MFVQVQGTARADGSSSYQWKVLEERHFKKVKRFPVEVKIKR